MAGKKYWTRQRLEEMNPDDRDFPLKLGRYSLRSSTGESRLQWKTRLLLLVDEGEINLDADRKTSKDFYLRRPPYVIEALSRFGVTDEADQRKLTEDPRTPLLAAFVNDSERRLKEALEVPPGTDPVLAAYLKNHAATQRFDISDQHGLLGVRELMTQWVDDTYQRKFEEASCDLNCMACPSAKVLACVTENITPLKLDGYNVEFIQGELE